MVGQDRKAIFGQVQSDPPDERLWRSPDSVEHVVKRLMRAQPSDYDLVAIL